MTNTFFNAQFNAVKDLFKVSLESHKNYLLKDINNVNRQQVFAKTVEEILRLNFKGVFELQSDLDHLHECYDFKWWDIFGQMKQQYRYYAYELAIDILTDLEERFYGTYRYPDERFYNNYNKIKELFK